MTPIILIFSQVFSFQIYFYPLILFGGILSWPFKKLKINSLSSDGGIYFFWFYALFLISITLIDLIRGASVELIVFNLRFFYGIGFVFLCFRLVNNLYIGRSFFWVMVLFGLYESIVLNIFESYPFYWSYSAFDYELLIGRGVQLGGFKAILGPALNSSVTGTIYAIMFFIMMKYKLTSHASSNVSDTILIILLFICMLLCSSTVAYGVFFIGVIGHFISIQQLKSLINNMTRNNVIIIGLLLLTTFFLNKQFPIFNSLDFEPVIRVLYHKYYSFTVSYHWAEIILGWNSLQNIPSSSIGGDFMYLHQFLLNGFLPSFLFLFVLFILTPKHNRIYLILGMISTLHYGALYSLLGQLFFGAIIANKLRL